LGQKPVQKPTAQDKIVTLPKVPENRIVKGNDPYVPKIQARNSED
jgi:hypothetical protein